MKKHARVSVGVLGLRAVEKSMADALIRLRQPGATPLEPYALSRLEAADVLVVDVAEPRALQALEAYKRIHRMPPTIVAVGEGELPEGTGAHIGRPLLASTLRGAIVRLAIERMAVAGAETQADAEFPNARILVAETDADRAQLLGSALVRLVGQVEIALTGQQAQAHIDSGKLDVVVLDSALKNPDAYALGRAAKKSSDAAVILLLAATDSADRTEGTSAGCDTYLIRPVNELILQEVIAEYLDEV